MDWTQIAERVVDDLQNRPRGPLGFRFVMQPLMASALAFRDGVRDARTGSRPYLMSLFWPDARRRRDSLADGLRSVARVLVLALALDTIYQAVTFRDFYPGEAVLVALALGFLPYLLLRGPFSLLARWILRMRARRRG